MHKELSRLIRTFSSSTAKSFANKSENCKKIIKYIFFTKFFLKNFENVSGKYRDSFLIMFCKMFRKTLVRYFTDPVGLILGKNYYG